MSDGERGALTEPGRVARGTLPLALALLAACGNLTAGGATGKTTVYVTGESADPEPTSTATLRGAEPVEGSRIGRAPTVPYPTPAVRAGTAEDDTPEGELELEFELHLVTDGTAIFPLTDEPVQVRVRFPGPQEVQAATRTVPTARYVALRVVFTDIEAEVDAGLVVDGVTITGPVDVELEADSLVVERPLDLDIGDGDEAELLVDMNASAWLAVVDPDLRRVAGSVVASALRVVRR